jgi:hypothetical protein
MSTAHGETGRHLASIIVPLLVHDLPVALWWPADPTVRLASRRRLLPIADRLIVDGSSWSGDGLERLGRDGPRSTGARLVVVPTSRLLRQARWREALASVYDLPDLRPHLGRCDRSRRVSPPRSRRIRAGLDERGAARLSRRLAGVAAGHERGLAAPADDRWSATSRLCASRATRWRSCSRRPLPTSAPGSTVRVDIASRLRGAELVGRATATDQRVDVSILDNGHERVRRTYAVPQLNEVDLLGQAVEEGASDPVSVDALATAGRLLGVD